VPVDLDVLLDELRLIGPAGSADVAQAITDPPRLVRTIDGASTLEVALTDRRRTLLGSGLLVEKSWALVDDVAFELVGVRKTGDRVTLTFEDLVIAALRRQTAAYSVPANTTTWAAFVRRLAADAQQDVLIDPTDRGLVRRALERNAGPDATDSWRVIADGSEQRGLRAFSDGDRLVVGSDDWLATLVTPLTVFEHVGPVHNVDFTLDVGRKDNSATVEVDARRWAVMPGRSVTLQSHLGPASGRWLVQSFERLLTRQRATVRLTRPRLVLPEPAPEALPVVGPVDPPLARVLNGSGIRHTPAPPPRGAGPRAPENPRQADQRAKNPADRLWAWPTYDKRITSGFGPRRSPKPGASRNHQGIDLAGRTGSPVFAARAGKVRVAGFQGGYGNLVAISHGEGVESRYAHLSQINVREGQQVTIGTEVGLVGSTGTATGPHLHFEIRINGVAQDPVRYLP
jgi:hypothetical protein